MFSWEFSFFCFALFISIVRTQAILQNWFSHLRHERTFSRKDQKLLWWQIQFFHLFQWFSSTFFFVWCRCEHISYKNGFSCHFVRRWCFKTKIEVTSSSFHNSWIKHKRNHWLCHMQYFCTMYANKLRAKKKIEKRNSLVCIWRKHYVAFKYSWPAANWSTFWWKRCLIFFVYYSDYVSAVFSISIFLLVSHG